MPRSVYLLGNVSVNVIENGRGRRGFQIVGVRVCAIRANDAIQVVVGNR